MRARLAHPAPLAWRYFFLPLLLLSVCALAFDVEPSSLFGVTGLTDVVVADAFSSRFPPEVAARCPAGVSLVATGKLFVALVLPLSAALLPAGAHIALCAQAEMQP